MEQQEVWQGGIDVWMGNSREIRNIIQLLPVDDEASWTMINPLPSQSGNDLHDRDFLPHAYLRNELSAKIVIATSYRRTP